MYCRDGTYGQAHMCTRSCTYMSEHIHHAVRAFGWKACKGRGNASLGSPCALDMTAAICLLSSSLSWLRSASMPAGITVCKGLPAPPAPPSGCCCCCRRQPFGESFPSRARPAAHGLRKPGAAAPSLALRPHRETRRRRSNQSRGLAQGVQAESRA